ncbi:CC0125/CC1285 family lipoprotein [Shewanella sp. ENK2]|uniref:CC0125/CC1285 family lipoprotein n=1 Tax=Shewanella sp. ENK2 TaxID=2775245 RepID=UPI003748827D
MKFLPILLVSSILFSGCATTYQSNGFSGGYSETQLDDNVFKVAFRSNGNTSKERVADFTLLRSAELTMQGGYKYFVIVDANSYTSNSTYTTPTIATTNANTSTYGNANIYGNNATYNANTYGTATTTVSGGQTYNISKPSSSNTIVCFNEKPTTGFSYNAEFIFKSITKKYDIEHSVQ